MDYYNGTDGLESEEETLYSSTSIDTNNNLTAWCDPSLQSVRGGHEIAIAFFKALAMAFIIATAVCGNVLVIVSVFRYERLRLIANSFLVSLAVADLLVAAVVMPFNAVQQVAGRWPFGEFVCDLFNANDVLFSTASLLHLCCVSVDRYLAVTDPFRYERRMTRRRVAAMLACLWTASTVLAHVPIHLKLHRADIWQSETANETSRSSTPDCIEMMCKFEVNKVYGIVSCAISFWFPAIIMVAAYFSIYRAAQRQEKFIQSLSLSAGSSTDRLDNNSVTGNGNSIAVIGGGLGARMLHRPSDNPSGVPQSRRKMKREHKAAKTLGVIMGAFLCCWLPFFTWYVISAVCGEHCAETPEIVVSVLFWIGYLNSALNPLIYALFNRDFRHAFLRTLACCCCRCPAHGSGQRGGWRSADRAGGWADNGGGVSNGAANRRMVNSATEETWLR